MIRALGMLTGVAFMVFVAPNHTQSGTPTLLASVAAPGVHLVNQGNQALLFYIRVDGGEWKEFTLGSGDNNTFRCASACEGGFEFFMRTEERHVHYRLEAGTRYILYWNSAEKIWDLLVRVGTMNL